MRYGKPTRESIVEQLKMRLSTARLQISIILLLTAASAFAVSVLLLHAGITSMPLRYPIAVIAGYLVFLLLLRVWIWLQSEEKAAPDLTGVDLAGVVTDIGLPDTGVDAEHFSLGGGGDFSGGGAGGSWADTDVKAPIPVAFAANPAPSGSAASSSGGSSLFGDVDIDDGLALIVVLVVVAVVFSALIYVVWIAPVLLAELMVDAAVAGSLYRPVKNIDRRHWLMTALRKTAVPAVIVVLVLTVAGAVIQGAEPDVVTIGEFLKTL